MSIRQGAKGTGVRLDARQAKVVGYAAQCQYKGVCLKGLLSVGTADADAIPTWLKFAAEYFPTDKPAVPCNTSSKGGAICQSATSSVRISYNSGRKRKVGVRLTRVTSAVWVTPKALSARAV
jgi:hypothetical protein